MVLVATTNTRCCSFEPYSTRYDLECGRWTATWNLQSMQVFL